MKILLKLATRERPQRAISTVQSFLRNALDKRDVSVVISADTDDASMTPDVIGQLRSMRCDVVMGTSTNKVFAINRDLEGRQFDIIVAIADDMEAARSWDRIIRADMDREWPNLDGALHYNDGHVGDRLCTIPVMGVNLFRKFGYVYHPDYVSLWCDNEYTEVLRTLGRLPYLRKTVIEHRHPSHRGGHAPDALLQRTEAFYGVDEATFRRRQSLAPPFLIPEIDLSIGVASLASRRESRNRLLRQLNAQVNALASPARVEIITDIDAKQVKVGEKRQRILEAAKGRFVCFADDDDLVADHYVASIVGAIDSNPQADCIGLKGVITTAGRDPHEFIHSISCGSYRDEGGVHYRTPNHLNPVRREHALGIGFKPMACGEDTDYAQRLMGSGLLQTEVMIESQIYRYLFDPKRTETQRRSAPVTRGIHSGRNRRPI